MCTDRGAITERADRPAMKVAAFQRPRGTLMRDASTAARGSACRNTPHDKKCRALPNIRQPGPAAPLHRETPSQGGVTGSFFSAEDELTSPQAASPCDDGPARQPRLAAVPERLLPPRRRGSASKGR
jgi:hypothetical protein